MSDESFVLLDLHDPSIETLLELQERHGIHELAIEDAIEAHHQRPKLDRYDTLLALVVKSVVYDDSSESLGFGELLLLASPAFLITIRHGEACALPSVAAMIDDGVDRGNASRMGGPFGAMHGVIDYVTDGYGPVMDAIEVDLGQIEQDVFSTERTNPAERIYRLKREVLSLRRNIAPLVRPLSTLANGELLVVPKEMRNYFGDVEDHVRRTVDRIEQADALLSDVLNANLSQVGVKQNADMRRMTAWAVLFLVPTLLTGLWGMNFGHMPELDWAIGYPLAVGSMVLITGIAWFRLKRAGWI